MIKIEGAIRVREYRDFKTIHLGKNPINGGRPARERICRNRIVGEFCVELRKVEKLFVKLISMFDKLRITNHRIKE